MSAEEVVPSIPESVFEHRVDFASNWIAKWGAPNPFLSLLLDGLKHWNISLSDLSFADGKSVGDVNLTVAVKQQQAIVKIGLDYVSVFAQNPDWEDAEEIIALCEQTITLVASFVQIPVRSQESTIAFHVLLGADKLRKSTASLLNPSLVRTGVAFGISVHELDHSLEVERSVRYKDAAFIRIKRSFSPEADLVAIAEALYEDEKRVLALMNIEGVL